MDNMNKLIRDCAETICYGSKKIGHCDNCRRVNDKKRYNCRAWKYAKRIIENGYRKIATSETTDETSLEHQLVEAVKTLHNHCKHIRRCEDCFLHDNTEEKCVMEWLADGYDTEVDRWITFHKDSDKSKSEFIYAARDIKTRKLVSDITNPRRKYWDKKGNAESAIDTANKYKRKLHPDGVELVTFKLVECNNEGT